jgi:hypothetical protein
VDSGRCGAGKDLAGRIYIYPSTTAIFGLRHTKDKGSTSTRVRPRVAPPQKITSQHSSSSKEGSAELILKCVQLLFTMEHERY